MIKINDRFFYALFAVLQKNACIKIINKYNEADDLYFLLKDIFCIKTAMFAA
jgi:hypothetical protein